MKNDIECSDRSFITTKRSCYELQGWGSPLNSPNSCTHQFMTRPGKDRVLYARVTHKRPPAALPQDDEGIKAHRDADTIRLCVDPKENWSRLGVCCQEEKRRRGLYRIGRAHSVHGSTTSRPDCGRDGKFSIATCCQLLLNSIQHEPPGCVARPEA